MTPLVLGATVLAADSSSHVDWEKTITLSLLIGGLLWTVVRPAAIQLLFHLLSTRDDQMADVIFGLLRKSPERFKAISEAVWRDRIEETDMAIEEALNLARANGDSLNQVSASINAHGAEIKEMRALMKDVPSLAPALERLSRSMEQVGERMEKMSEIVARVDERQRVMWPNVDRRVEQVDPSPRRREDDHR